MSRFIFSIALVVFCIAFSGCGEEPPEDFLAPDTGGLMEAGMVKLEKQPTVVITLPRPTGLNPALVPPIFHVDWRAEKTKYVRWILLSTLDFGGSWTATEDYIRSNPDAPEWSDWIKYKPKKNEGTSYYPPPQDFGQYVFAVQAKNPQGDATDIVFGKNMVRLLVSRHSTGPLLKVSNRFIGTMLTAVITTPPWIVDIPSGVAMAFSLTADASSYGAVVSGYRWGWDISDPDDDSQWSIDFTPFVGEVAEVPPHTFFFGTHTIYIEVIDCWGFKSRIPVQTNVIPAVMDRPLLVVDDWEEIYGGWARTNGAIPSDAEHDQFWLAMTDEVDGFDLNSDVIEVDAGNIPPLELLLNYKSIIWSAFGAHNAYLETALHEIVRFRDLGIGMPIGGEVLPNLIALYMAAGGHVLLCGGEIMVSSINPNSFMSQPPVYPLIFRYELGGDQSGIYEDSDIGQWGIGEESFPYYDCCLNVLDFAYVSSQSRIRRSGVHNCPVNMVRTHNPRTDGLRTTMPVDIGSDFPTMNLRPEAAGPGKWWAPERSGLNCDIYNPSYFGNLCSVAEIFPQRSCLEPIWANGCLDPGSAIYGAPVAFWTTTYADRVPEGGVAARSAVWGFHPVYFNPEEVKVAARVVLFDEWQLLRKTAAPDVSDLPDATMPISGSRP